jgi:hypothetical protein
MASATLIVVSQQLHDGGRTCIERNDLSEMRL